ncbi:MAG: YkgJ family cysteine cluster protein [Candidatus Helarchaeota archaeon]
MIKFKCLRCGDCCHVKYLETDSGYIPIYLDELNNIKKIAKDMNINVEFRPDFVYADIIKKRLIITAYAMILKEKCVFYDKKCRIYENRPITCKAFPILTFRIDSHRKMLHINNGCRFVAQNLKLYELNYSEIIEAFPYEYEQAKKVLIKQKEILYKILQLEMDKKIDIGFLRNDHELFGLEVQNIYDKKFKNWQLTKLSEIDI